MAFFQKQFAYEATTDSALDLLRRLHAERLPGILREQPAPAMAGEPAGRDGHSDEGADVAEAVPVG